MNIIDKLVGFIPYLDNPFFIKIVKSVILIFLFWIIHFVLRIIFYKKISDVKTRYRWQKISSYIVVFIGIIVVGRVWSEGVQSLATYLGLVSAGVAIALKDPISNIAGWIFIIAHRPFEVGDRIQVEDFAGDVIDLSLFQFSILEIGNWVDADQSTGRIIHIPNGKLFTCEFANYDKGFKFIWNEIPVLITFESDWQKAKIILAEIADKHKEVTSKNVEQQIRKATRKFMIFYKNLTPIVYTEVKDSGVLLTIRYLCETRNRRGSKQEIWEDVLTAFSKHKDIDLAYPTRRFFDNLKEGK
ncbi:MAG: mechanosensitive ion channel [Candidatus Cloacimonetes bacterium]|nr:mechanosensitive ion channel [Candidatus Cloacimonadota bacterium]